MVKVIPALLLALSMLLPATPWAGQTATDVATPFSLLDTNQHPVDLATYQGKVVLLTFWATWCSSCREELPDLDTLHTRLANQGFTVLGVCVEPSTAVVSGYLRHHPVSFPVLLDQRGDVADSYRLSGFPATFILGKDGTIKHRHLGYDKESLALYEKEILDLLNQ